jgi:integrase
MQVPTYAEASAYLNALSRTRLYPGLVLAAFMGLRRGEALAVRWQDVDLAGGSITVTRQLTASRGTLSFTEPKTRQGRRTVPMPQVAVDLLSAVKAARRRELMPRQMWDESALVCCGRAGQPIRPDSFTHELHKRVKQHGLEPLHLHQLRHTFATESLRAGERPDVVAAMLGHTNVSTTLGIYADVNEADKEAAAGRVQAAWDAASEQTRCQSAARTSPVVDISTKRACK